MKASRAEVGHALKTPGQSRFFLFHGPDEAGSRALAKAIAAALGPDAEAVALGGAELKADPARLADEAASISLFGGPRYIIVEPAGEEIVPALEALLEAPVAGNPVAVVAGALRASSSLLKLALADPAALAFASYAPEGRQAELLALDLARERGLIIRADVARRIAEAGAGNRALIASELEKLALFADAAPERPRPIDHDALDAIGVASEDGDLARLTDAVGGGDAAALQAELSRLAGEGKTGVLLGRQVIKRMLLLARLRARVEGGDSVGAVMASEGKSMFWKDKDAIPAQLPRWRSATLAKAVTRLMAAQAEAMKAGGAGPIAVDEELFAVCREAARHR